MTAKTTARRAIKRSRYSTRHEVARSCTFFLNPSLDSFLCCTTSVITSLGTMPLFLNDPANCCDSVKEENKPGQRHCGQLGPWQ
eukprot:IDg4861t1